MEQGSIGNVCIFLYIFNIHCETPQGDSLQIVYKFKFPGSWFKLMNMIRKIISFILVIFHFQDEMFFQYVIKYQEIFLISFVLIIFFLKFLLTLIPTLYYCHH